MDEEVEGVAVEMVSLPAEVQGVELEVEVCGGGINGASARRPCKRRVRRRRCGRKGRERVSEFRLNYDFKGGRAGRVKDSIS